MLLELFIPNSKLFQIKKIFSKEFFQKEFPHIKSFFGINKLIITIFSRKKIGQN